jgi:hypothetical protein
MFGGAAGPGVNTYVTGLTGGNSTDYKGRVSNFNFTCKDFKDINAVVSSADRKADVCLGRDPLSDELVGTIDCPSFMDGSYCIGGPDPGGAWSDRCNLWYKSNSRAQEQNKLDYCERDDNYLTASCMKFCQSDGAPDGDKRWYKDQCNNLYRHKCTGKEMSLKECSCYRSFDSFSNLPGYDLVKKTAQEDGGSNFVQCYFDPCKSSGYKEYANGSQEVHCPSCFNNLAVSADASSSANIGEISMSCTTQIGQTDGMPSTTSKGAPSANATGSTTLFAPAKAKISVLLGKLDATSKYL